MRAILISIKPKWIAKILNGEKTIEIRKTMPKCELPIDVYIYCTKNLKSGKEALSWLNEKGLKQVKNITYEEKEILGKVVAKFMLNKVEEIENITKHFYTTISEYENCNHCYTGLVNKESCLSTQELHKYLVGKKGYAWYISNLVIFDRPKELSEFNNCDKYPYTKYIGKVPQSWCYCEELK